MLLLYDNKESKNQMNTIVKINKNINPRLSDVLCIYEGKPNCCMCGCSGVYYYASIHHDLGGQERGYPITDKEINDTRIKQIFDKFICGGKVENMDNKIFTKILGNIQYTIYFIKQQEIILCH